MPALLEKNNQFTVGEEEIAAENRQQLLDVLIRLLTDTDLEVSAACTHSA
jgi:alpha-ketoglutarate-dependent taurine dioxygenase